MDTKGSEKNILKNMLKLLTGEGIGRVIGFVVTPIITRIYGPSNMGVLAVFVSMVTILSSFSSMKYSAAIPLSRNNSITTNTVVLCFLLLSVVSTLSLVVMLISGDELFKLLSVEEISSYWWLIPIGLMFTGVFDILTQYTIRGKAFATLATANVSQKITGSCVKIGLGLLGMKPLGLLIGDLFMTTGGISLILRKFWSDLKNYRYVSLRKIKYCAIRYVDFPKYRMPSQLLLSLSGNLPVLFFAWKFSTAVTGQIGLARTMLSIPVTFIGYSVGRAFLGEIAELGKENGAAIYKITKSVIKKLFQISLIPFVVIGLFGPWIFQIVFGSEWYDAGVFARLMTIFLIFQFIYSPIEEAIFNVFEKQSLSLVIEISRIIIILLVLFSSYGLDLSSFDTVLVYSIGLAIQYFIALLIVLSVIRKYQTV